MLRCVDTTELPVIYGQNEYAASFLLLYYLNLLDSSCESSILIDSQISTPERIIGKNYRSPVVRELLPKKELDTAAMAWAPTWYMSCSDVS